MKRYLFGVFAVAIAISLAAFTTPDKPKKSLVDFYVFEFNPNLQYSVNNVETEGNWIYKGLNQSMCEIQNEKACRVKVVQSYVNDPTGSPTLKSTTNITATLSGSTAHVTSIDGTGSGNAYTNQAD